MAYKVIYTDDHLAHHGILGQKWGIRRFQNSDGSLTSAGRKRYGTGEKRDSNNEKESSSNSKSFSINSKYVKAAAIIGAAAIAGYTTYKVAGVIKENSSSDMLSKLSFGALEKSINKLENNEEYHNYFRELKKEKYYNSLIEIPKLKEDNRDTETKVEEMLNNGTINPFLKSCIDAGYDPLTMDWSSDDGYLKFSEKNGGDSEVYDRIAKSTSNCAMCTTSIIARLKGYDVSSNEIYMGCTVKRMTSWFKDASFESCGKTNDWNGTLNNVAKQGNGAYGNMVLSNGSMSHSVFYCVSNGKTRVYDGQLGFEWTNEKFEQFGFVPSFTGVMRADNKELSDAATLAFNKSNRK